ncbi:MAG: PilZ domain-containing protein [Rhizobiaceae bacterium]
MFTSSVRRGRHAAPKRHVDRREERVQKVKSASICIDGADLNFPCTVRDIHSSGARMSIANIQGVADSFLLIVRSEDLVARCKVAWRKTNEMGVRFVRVGVLAEEERMKKEQQSAHQMELQQQVERANQERLHAEQEALQRQQLQAQRIAQINAARMQIMGMDPTKPYTEEDLKSAYRRRAMSKHPDQGGDPLEFQQLTEIYNLMLNDLQAAAGAKCNVGD